MARVCHDGMGHVVAQRSATAILGRFVAVESIFFFFSLFYNNDTSREEGVVNDSERIRDNRWQFGSEIRVQNASVESMRSQEAVEAKVGMLIPLSPAS